MAPVLVTAVAAPAYAASGPCVGGTAVLQEGTSPLNLTFLPSTVTATIEFTTTGWGTDTTPGDTGEVHRTEFPNSNDDYNYIKLHHKEGMDLNDTITITITFTQAVIEPVAHHHRHRQGHRPVDRPRHRHTLGYTVAAKGANVIGAGTATGITSTTGPFRSR